MAGADPTGGVGPEGSGAEVSPGWDFSSDPLAEVRFLEEEGDRHVQAALDTSGLEVW